MRRGIPGGTDSNRGDRLSAARGGSTDYFCVSAQQQLIGSPLGANAGPNGERSCLWS